MAGATPAGKDARRRVTPPPGGPLARRLGATRANMLVIAFAYGIYALSLLLQGQRWAKTPAYHDLLAVMPQAAWGACHAAASAALFAAVVFRRERWLSVAALTVALVITVPWTLAFMVRWATSDSTTPVTWVSWAVNAYLLVRAAVLLDYREVLLRSLRDDSQAAPHD
jgi:hypothetical protein